MFAFMSVCWQCTCMPEVRMITVKQAAALAKKSEKTIRRWLAEITDDETHPDRTRIEPTVEEEKKLRRTKRQFSWRINEDLVRERFLVKQTSKLRQNTKTRSNEVGESELEFLRRTNEQLHEDLREEREHNRNMQRENNERQREMNHIMKGFQDQQLPSGEPTDDDSIDGKVVAAEVTARVEPVHSSGQVIDAEEIKQRKSRRWFPRWANQGPAIRWDSETKSRTVLPGERGLIRPLHRRQW